MKDIAVSPYEGTIRLDTLRLRFCFLNLRKTAETIGNVVGQPCAAESRMGSQPPYGKFSHIQLHIFLEGKQQARQPIMPEGIGFLKLGALFEDAFLCKDLIDAIHPFLRITPAALKNQALLISHPTELLCRNLLNAHSFIPSILTPCS